MWLFCYFIKASLHLFNLLFFAPVLGDCCPHLRRTPPSREALRHSGGDRRRCTSPTVTLYLELELSRERRPGTEQKTSAGLDRAERPRPRPSLPMLKAERAEPFSLDGMGTVEGAEKRSWSQTVRERGCDVRCGDSAAPLLMNLFSVMSSGTSSSNSGASCWSCRWSQPHGAFTNSCIYT